MMTSREYSVFSAILQAMHDTATDVQALEYRNGRVIADITFDAAAVAQAALRTCEAFLRPATVGSPPMRATPMAMRLLVALDDQWRSTSNIQARASVTVGEHTTYMNTLRRLARSGLAEPSQPHGGAKTWRLKPQPARGFISSLTGEQLRAAMAYTGPDHHGSDEFRRDAHNAHLGGGESGT